LVCNKGSSDGVCKKVSIPSLLIESGPVVIGNISIGCIYCTPFSVSFVITFSTVVIDVVDPTVIVGSLIGQIIPFTGQPAKAVESQLVCNINIARINFAYLVGN
jgi:hypothetical protein